MNDESVAAASWAVGLRRDSVITWARPWYILSNSPSLNVNSIRTCLGRTLFVVSDWYLDGKQEESYRRSVAIGLESSPVNSILPLGVESLYNFHGTAWSKVRRLPTDISAGGMHLFLNFPCCYGNRDFTELLSATDFESQRGFGRRSSYKLSWISTLDGDWWWTLRPGRLSSPEISAVLIVQKTGWALGQVWKIHPPPTKIRSPDRPVRRVAHSKPLAFQLATQILFLKPSFISDIWKRFVESCSSHVQ